jgi:hypothetical protein
LGYGANLFNDKIKAVSAAADGVDPCLLTGTPANQSMSGDTTLTGSSDYAGCLAYTNTAFEMVDAEACYMTVNKSCYGNDAGGCACTIEGNPRPTIPSDNKFLAMSNYATILVGNLNVPEETGWPSDALAATSAWCALSYEAGHAQLPTTPLQYVASTCMTAVQATELLSVAYGLKSNPIHMAADVNGVEATWALGAMVSRANLLAISGGGNANKLSAVETGAIGFGTAVGAMLLVGGLVLAVRRKQNVRCAFFGRGLHSRLLLEFTSLLSLKRSCARDQCHSYRDVRSLTG